MSIDVIGGILLSIGIFLFAYLNKVNSESDQFISRIDKIEQAIKAMVKYKKLNMDELASDGIPTTDAIITNLDPRDRSPVNKLIKESLENSIISSSVRYGECIPLLVAVKEKRENEKSILERRSKFLSILWPISCIPH